MAFVDGSASVSLAVTSTGRGTEVSGGSASVANDIVVGGTLVNPTRIKSVRALSIGRLRVDFTAPVDNNSALADVANYCIRNTALDDPYAPLVLSVSIPNQTKPQFVELVVTGMKQGASYMLALNSGDIQPSPELLQDADMEAIGTAAWGAGDSTVTKIPGSLDGSGTQTLKQTKP